MKYATIKINISNRNQSIIANNKMCCSPLPVYTEYLSIYHNILPKYIQYHDKRTYYVTYVNIFSTPCFFSSIILVLLTIYGHHVTLIGPYIFISLLSSLLNKTNGLDFVFKPLNFTLSILVEFFYSLKKEDLWLENSYKKLESG